MKPEEIRDGIPLLDDYAYLNTGASGPSPQRVNDAMEETRDAHAEAHADDPYGNEEEVADETREAFGSLLNAPSENVALTSNTTDGINVVADCFDWRSDDTIVTTELEHPAGVLPWGRVAEVHGAELRVVPTEKDGTLDREAYADAVEGATLVCLSSVSWYGVRLPVEELVETAHDSGASVVVDSAQSVGAEDVDVRDWDAEYVAAPAHKWLLGPWGVGFLYVAEGAPVGAQTRVGYKSAVEPSDSAVLHEDARRFEVSTSSPALLAGAHTAVETMERVGLETVEEHVARLTSRLESGLGERHVSTGGGLVRFDDPTPDDTVERLKDKGVVIRSLPNGDLRASLHVFNTQEDIERLLDVL
ncbi:MAG: aminotransferase class V-fold PLP-dependent enzyme [Halobacteriales archaeon]|nr:aminotransferase class V-fold PLP-dependent enzyme [Halobacteriales archaeon]